MKKKNLPRSNVTYRKPGSAEEMDERSLRGMICNPVYAGIAPFPQIISDEAWVKAAAQLISEEGPEQFLVNLLDMLRQTMADYTYRQSAPGQTVVESRAAWSDNLYCSHDGFPMINIGDDFVCVSEYLFAHLEGTTVRDVITSPVFTLVFQNGHTLPLLCPDCGQSLHVKDEDAFFDSLQETGLVDLEWDEVSKTVILYFGPIPDYEELDIDELDSEPVISNSIEVHLNSVFELTCPHQGAGLEVTTGD
ncbi:MAG: hypothetical protein ACE5G8_10640 [Anaerolineae bacterium]